MDIFDVFGADELDELSDDPQVAFSDIVRRAYSVLRQRTATIDPRDEGWREIQEERHGFMNLVIASGKRLEIAPFVNYQVPKTDPFGETDWKEFKAELDHYVTQMAIDNSIRGKRDSVELPPKSKDRIRQHIHALKKLLDDADITDAKKAKLREKLTAFEGELEKRRLSLLKVTRVTFEVLALTSGTIQAGDIGFKLITNVLQEVAEAKAVDDETRQLPLTAEPAMLSPPRAPEVTFQGPKRRSSTSAPAFESGGMDDDIPF